MRSLRLMASAIMLVMTIVSISPARAAQDVASPVAIDAPNDLNLPSIDSQLLGTGTSAQPASEVPRMLLERITLPAGSSLSMHTAAGPELLVVELGTPSVTDSFGFTGPIAPTGTFFEVNAQYTLSNLGTEDASTLRLSLAQGTEAEAASPVAGSASVSLLVDSPLEDPQLSEPTLTIAKLTWHPGNDTQTLDHDAAIGLIVVNGTLFAKSPSGFDGQLAANMPVVFPASTPLEARAGEDGPASALVITITDGATRVVSVPEPTPTPMPTAVPTLEPSITPTSTETSTPTQSPLPTETIVPTETSTPLPTATPTETPTPMPTVDPNTPAGSILQNSSTWIQGASRLTLEAGISENRYFQSQSNNRYDAGHAFIVSIYYTNIGDSRQDLVFSAKVLTASDDNGHLFEVHGFENVSGSWHWGNDGLQRVIIEPGADFEFFFIFENPGVDGNYLLQISEFGDIRDAKWGFTVSQGKIVPMPASAVQAYESISSASTTSQSKVGQEGEQLASTRAATLPASLPPLVLTEHGTRGQSEITSTFPNPAEADALFGQWGWSGSNYEVFVAPHGVVGTDGVYEVDIGIHQLAGIREAEEALQYFRVARISLLGLWDIEAPALGSMSRAVIGPSGDGGYEASVYVALGSQVVRVTAFSWYDYPLATATAIARQVIGA